MRVEIGQEAGLARRRQIDRLAFGGGGAGRIGGVERIGNEDRGLAGALRRRSGLAAMAPRNRPSRVPLSTMTSVSGSIGRLQAVAPVEPGGGGLAEAFGALVGRIAAEIVEMGLQHRADERRDRVLRLADRQVDRGLARLDVGQQLMQPHERRAAFGLQRGRLRSGGGGGHELDIAGGGTARRQCGLRHHRGGEVKA